MHKPALTFAARRPVEHYYRHVTLSKSIENKRMNKRIKIIIEQSNDAAQDWVNLKDLILRLLPRMASLAAVSLAGVSLFQVLDKLNASETIVDEVLAFCAVMLLLCYPVTIGAVRTKHIGRALFLGRMALVMFLSVIMLLIFAGCYVLLGLHK